MLMYLWSMMLIVGVALAAVPQAGPYPTASGKFVAGNLVGGGSQKAAIYYPTASNAHTQSPSYNVIAFAHGLGSGEPNFDHQYSPLLTTLASYGFVVVAPLSCPTEFCPDALATDLISLFRLGEANRTLHPGFAYANFSATGVVGHSMGGTAAGYAAANPGNWSTLQAYVALHGPPEGAAKKLKLPTMYTTGGDDDIVYPVVVKQAFEESKNANPRVLVELSDATHFEPASGGGPFPAGKLRLNPYAAQFFLCHVSGASQACSLLYDDSSDQSLCNAYKDKYQPPKGECKIQK